jgi:hypothetical protein
MRNTVASNSFRLFVDWSLKLSLKSNELLEKAQCIVSRADIVTSDGGQIECS